MMKRAVGGRWLFGVVLAVALHGCSSESAGDDEYIADDLGISAAEANDDSLDEYGTAENAISDYQTPDREPFDEGAARAAAEDELASSGYDLRYGCTEDCSGHDAGWEWRAGHGYSTPGYSNSFDEGGRAFDEALEERVDEMRWEYEAGADFGY